MEIFLSVLLPAIRSAFTAMRTTTASLKLRAFTLRVLQPADAVRLVLPQPAGLRPAVRGVVPVPPAALPVVGDEVPVAELLEVHKLLLRLLI